MNLNDLAILNIKGSDYHCIISRFSKSEAIKRNIIKHKNLLSHIKMGKEILTFDDIETEKEIFFTSIKVLFFKKM